METTILVGDCLKKLQELPDESVHCAITSPPYWGLRKYEGGLDMICRDRTGDILRAKQVLFQLS